MILFEVGNIILESLLLQWLARKFSGMKITYPLDWDFVENEHIVVKGRFRCRFGLKFVLLTEQDGKRFWPQGYPNFNDSRKTWEKDVWIGSDPNKEHKIHLASYSKDIQPLINYYSQVHDATNRWVPIIIHDIPKGLKLMQTVAVKIKTKLKT